MKKMQNNLDERQEQELLKIEHNGCWFSWAGLLAMIVVQLCIYGFDGFKMVAGEFAIFMIISLYMVVACLKHGIWDRRLKPDKKTNFIIALISAIACGLLTGVTTYRIDSSDFTDIISMSLVTGIFTFVIGFAALMLMSNAYKKDQKAIEEAEDED